MTGDSGFYLKKKKNGFYFGDIADKNNNIQSITIIISGTKLCALFNLKGV